MNKIAWSDDYLIGVEIIDLQHKYLFKLINKTLQCKEKVELQLALINLYKYTREHFTEEETLMRNSGYIDYEQHQKHHNLLITELNEHSQKALKTPEKKEGLEIFLEKWLISHIREEDLKIGSFLYEKSVSQASLAV